MTRSCSAMGHLANPFELGWFGGRHGRGALGANQLWPYLVPVFGPHIPEVHRRAAKAHHSMTVLMWHSAPVDPGPHNSSR